MERGRGNGVDGTQSEGVNEEMTRIEKWMDKTKSEQQVLDCETSRSGCQGVWPNQAWDWRSCGGCVLGRFVPMLSSVRASSSAYSVVLMVGAPVGGCKVSMLIRVHTAVLSPLLID